MDSSVLPALTLALPIGVRLVGRGADAPAPTVAAQITRVDRGPSALEGAVVSS
jgi:hypothetical protein